MRVVTHPAFALRRQIRQLADQLARAVEELLDAVAAEPVLEDPDVVRMGGEVGHGYLVRAEGAFDLISVHGLRPGPALGRAQDDHRPRWASRFMTCPRVFLDACDLVQRPVERRRHLLVDLRRIVPAHDHRLVAVPAHQLEQLAFGDSREHRWVGNLVAV